MSFWVRNLLLALLVVALIAVPLLFVQGAEWGGADSLSTEAVGELQPDYEPWFESVFSPEDNERYLFGLQALLGSLVLSGIVGWLIGRYRGMTGTPGPERRGGTIVVAVAVVLALLLFFVNTEFGELQAFVSALQGVFVGMLGFFVGYPMGERYGAAHPAPAATGAEVPPGAQAGVQPGA